MPLDAVGGEIKALSPLRLSRRLGFLRHRRRVPLPGQSIALRRIEPHREVERPLSVPAASSPPCRRQGLAFWK